MPHKRSAILVCLVCCCLCTSDYCTFICMSIFVFVHVCSSMHACTFAGGELGAWSANARSISYHTRWLWFHLSSMLNPQMTTYFCSIYSQIFFKSAATNNVVPQWVDTHLIWDGPCRADIEHFWHVFWVALLCYITQFCCDVNTPADVHVHSPGFLLDLGVQVRHLLQRYEELLFDFLPIC